MFSKSRHSSVTTSTTATTNVSHLHRHHQLQEYQHYCLNHQLLLTYSKSTCDVKNMCSVYIVPSISIITNITTSCCHSRLVGSRRCSTTNTKVFLKYSKRCPSAFVVDLKDEVIWLFYFPYLITSNIGIAKNLVVHYRTNTCSSITDDGCVTSTTSDSS